MISPAQLLRPKVWLGIAGITCIVGPVAAAVWWHRRTAAPYLPFLYGGVIFVVFQLVLRLPWQIPLALWVKAHQEWMQAFLAFSAFTAGLFEEVGRYIGYRIFLPGDRRRTTAVMYGLGHGGIESILLVGVQSLGVLVAAVLASKGVINASDATAAIRKVVDAYDYVTTLEEVAERVAAITLNVGLALLVLQALVRRQPRWLGLAIAVHALFDFTAVFLAKQAHVPLWATEMVLVGLSVAFLFLVNRLEFKHLFESSSTLSPP